MKTKLSVLLRLSMGALACFFICETFAGSKDLPAAFLGSGECGRLLSLELQVINDHYEELQDFLEQKRQEHRKKRGVALDSNPFACRLCNGASNYISKLLKSNNPDSDWVVVLSFGSIDGFHHSYVYSKKLDLIVDATYKQFLVKGKIRTWISEYFFGKDEGEFLRDAPDIFIGSPLQYAQVLLAGGLSCKKVEVLVERTIDPVHWSKICKM